LANRFLQRGDTFGNAAQLEQGEPLGGAQDRCLRGDLQALVPLFYGLLLPVGRDQGPLELEVPWRDFIAWYSGGAMAMDAERTIQFILEQQAQTTVRMDQITERLDEITAVQKQQAERGAKTDRRIDAIAKLIQTGMKLLVKYEKECEERDKEARERDRKSNERIDKLVAALLRGGRNGR